MALVDQDWQAGPGGHQLSSWSLERLAADPITNLFLGRTYFNTATNRLRTYNGTTWTEYDSGGNATSLTQTAASARAGTLKVSGGADRTVADSSLTSTILMVDANGVLVAAVAGTNYLTADSTNTLTGKGFDANGTGNSITNIEYADLATTAQNTSTTLASASNTQIPSALAVKTYVDNAVVGLYDDRGNYDASVNTFPASGGSGASGAVAKGDIWRISVAGTLGTENVQVGDTVRALQDAPGQTAANWAIMQTNSDQATTTLVGLSRYATNAEANAKTVTNAAITPSNLTDYTRKVSANIGDGSAISFTITHNLNTRDITWTVWDTSTNDARYPNVNAATVNTVVVSGYVSAPATNAYRIVITG